jgi:D-serine deaminase-like pyridoxal phosphate-dependent protein
VGVRQRDPGPLKVDWRALLRDERLPAAIVDLDAVDRNAATLLSGLPDGVTVRIASKSIRIPSLMRDLLDAHGNLRGVMCYSPYEAELLAGRGFDDLLLAYPISRAPEARAVVAASRAARLRVVVDCAEHVRLLSEAAVAAGATVELCLDVDAAWRPAFGLHLGVRRSPVRSVADALAVGKAAQDLGGVRLTAVMAYEAQVAGLQDAQPDPVRSLAIGWIKGRSRPLAASRRKEVVAALREQGHAIDLVNGGGTGSLRDTAHDGSVTEVAAGSGFLDSHLFDGYTGLELVPAAFFAAPVVRRSDGDHVTAFGGGIVASGTPGPDRLPRVHWPPNLEPLGMEGWGEVQTPFRVTSGEAPALGDPVVARPAKAGEWLERFDQVLLVRGGAIVGRAPTYRGLGACFA